MQSCIKIKHECILAIFEYLKIIINVNLQTSLSLLTVLCSAVFQNKYCLYESTDITFIYISLVLLKYLSRGIL